MRKKIPFITAVISSFLFFVLPLQANHLDGLWRSDRRQITLRIEQEQDGFRAKRTDQGIWYHYTTIDNRRYTDRNGNWYELIDDDQLVWNEANSDKKLFFVRIEDDTNSGWNDDGYTGYNNEDSRWNNSDRSRDDSRWNDSDDYRNRERNNRWDDQRSGSGSQFISGNWFSRNGRESIQIAPSQDGIRVKSHHQGWDKFYADRSGRRFRDRNGNYITVLDRNHLSFKNQRGRQEIIFTRGRDGSHKENDWRD